MAATDRFDRLLRLPRDEPGPDRRTPARSQLDSTLRWNVPDDRESSEDQAAVDVSHAKDRL